MFDFYKFRKIPEEYNIFIATKGEYKNRIIIPIYKGNDIVYFQGRSISDDILKFKNPTVEKSSIIMNIDYFQRDKWIIVTEGIVDAMMVENHQGTCVLGGSISDNFLAELNGCTDKGIVIAVDNDERGEKERYKVRYFIPPNPIKDINEYKIKHEITDIYDTLVSNSVDYWTLSVKLSI